jgi:hypothetical protein
MKTTLIIFTLLFSQIAFSRQYIQCANTDLNYTDVMVVNLVTQEEGTLFISSGMENPENERILFDIKLSEKNDQTHEFSAVNTDKNAVVSIPAEWIGKSSDSFLIDLNFNQYRFTFSCFSRIYQ